MNKTPLERAVEKAGSQTELAARLTRITGRTVKQQNVWRWLNGTGSIPAEFAVPIEQAVDGEVTRFQLRPDVFPVEAA